MPQTTLISVAALAFVGGVVFSPTGWREEYPACQTTLEVIRYLPLPEPQPIYPAPSLLRVSDLPAPAVETEEPSVQPAEDASDPRPRHRHHRRHRHWR